MCQRLRVKLRGCVEEATVAIRCVGSKWVKQMRCVYTLTRGLTAWGVRGCVDVKYSWAGLAAAFEQLQTLQTDARIAPQLY